MIPSNCSTDDTCQRFESCNKEICQKARWNGKGMWSHLLHSNLRPQELVHVQAVYEARELVSEFSIVLIINESMTSYVCLTRERSFENDCSLNASWVRMQVPEYCVGLLEVACLSVNGALYLTCPR